VVNALEGAVAAVVALLAVPLDEIGLSEIVEDGRVATLEGTTDVVPLAVVSPAAFLTDVPSPGPGP